MFFPSLRNTGCHSGGAVPPAGHWPHGAAGMAHGDALHTSPEALYVTDTAHGPRLAQQLRAAQEEVAALTAEAEAQQRLARFDGHLSAGALGSCAMSLCASRCCLVQ